MNNNYLPIFTRVILREHPEYREHIVLRKSVYDGLFDLGAHDDDE